MSCPDPYGPNPPSDHASAPESDVNVHNLPTDAQIRGLTSALAASGGGRSSGDLALDLVLNQIVEQACLATGASGAAIALTRSGTMVCRATTGRNAPDLGVRLDKAGFSADCLRMGTLQRCDDAETDPRVDAAACRSLGVRSLLVIPLWYWGEFMGILEIFSPRPNAFGERDEQTLQALAYRIVRHAKQVNGEITGFPESSEEMPAFTTLPPPDEQSTNSPDGTQPMQIIELNSPPSPERSADPDRRDFLTVFLAGIALVIAFAIVALMVWRINWKAPVKRAAAPPSAEQSAAPASEMISLGGAGNAFQPADAAQAGSAPSKVRDDLRVTQASKKDSLDSSVRETANDGGLAIYDERGKLVYGKPIRETKQPVAQKPLPSPKRAAPRTELTASNSAPATTPQTNPMLGTSTPPAATGFGAAGKYVTITSDVADNLLIDRVEPDYPHAALRAHVQGSVTLDTFIGADGRVQQVTPVTGNPLLAEAATTAVRRWRYKPYTVKGRRLAVRTPVVIDFRLPQ